MADLKVEKRKYKNPLADGQDQILFFSLFAIGTIVIWTLKFRGINQIVITAFPVALMLIYAVVALFTKKYRIREDRVGDNIYYLGFLFTLVSLSYALYAYSPDGIGAADIITNFGIAIFTTIFGLAGRIFFNQMRQDPSEYEREARYSLAEASSALRSELADIAIDLSSFKRKIVQIAEEGVTDVANTAKVAMAENVASMTQVTQDIFEKIKNAFAAFTEHSTRLNESAEKNVEALQALFVRIEKIEASPDLLASKFEPAIAIFQEVADESLRRSKSQTNDLKRLREMVQAAVTSAEALQSTALATDTAILHKVDAFGDSLSRSLVIADKFAASLDLAGKNIVAEVERSRSDTQDFAQLVASQRETISGARSAIEADLILIQGHRNEAAKLVTESQESVKALQSSLVSLSRALVDQLRG